MDARGRVENHSSVVLLKFERKTCVCVWGGGGESDLASAWVAFLRKPLAATAGPEFIVLGFPEQGFVLSLGFRGHLPPNESLFYCYNTPRRPSLLPCVLQRRGLRLLKVWLGQKRRKEKREKKKKKKSGASSALMM